MSTSDLYLVYKTTATHFAEFRNGWGSAPILWGYLSETYLGRPWSMLDDSELWDLVDDTRVAPSLRLARYRGASI